MTKELADALVVLIGMTSGCILMLTLAKLMKMVINYFDKMEEKSQKELIKRTLKEAKKEEQK